MNENHIKTQNIEEAGYKTLFSGDPYLMSVQKKSQAISRAIYLITDFFDNREPIKAKMRNHACELIEHCLSLSTESSPERKSLLDNLIKTALLLISYSEIAMFSGIESQMNHSVLSTEIKGLISIVEDREKPARLGRHFVLDDAFFDKQNDNEPLPFIELNSTNAHIQGRSAQSTVVNQISNKTTYYGNQEKSPDLRSKHRNDAPHKATENTDLKKEQRRAGILSVIRTRLNPSIKDIADVIKDCSEKTIQRELLDMVSKGILKKEGERRWSRYSMVS